MYAIIEDSGTQIKVAPGDVLDIDLRDVEEGQSTLTFDRVLLVGDGASSKTAKIGMPYIDGATVTAEIVDEVKGEKLHVLKYKRRKGYRVKTGHRQRYLRVRISEISG